MLSDNNNTNIVKDPVESVWNFSGTTEFSEVPFNISKNDFLILTTLEAPIKEIQEDERASMDLVAVVDTSGSMSGEKINLMKITLKHVLNQLKKDDQFGIVSFSTTATVEFPLTSMTEYNKHRAQLAIENLNATNSTNLCGGICEGVNQIRRFNQNKICSCMIFTDGLANVGPSNIEGIMDALNTSSSSSWGYTLSNVALALYSWATAPTNSNSNPGSTSLGLPCTLNTFGFGQDHDPNLLKSISEKGDGIYYYIENTEEIPKAFSNCLGGLVSVVGQNVKLTFTPLNGVSISRILTTYKTNDLAHGVKELILGDIQSEEKRNIVLILSLPSLSVPDNEFVIMSVTADYFDCLASTKGSKTIKLALRRPENVTGVPKRNYNLDIEYNRLMGALAMEEAMQFANKGNLSEANTIISKAIESISSSDSASNKFCANLIADLKRCQAKMQNQQDYNQCGSKMMATNATAHLKERSSNMEWEGQERYSTSSRSVMQKKISKTA